MPPTTEQLETLSSKGSLLFCLHLLDALPPLPLDLGAYIGPTNEALIDAANATLRSAVHDTLVDFSSISPSLSILLTDAQAKTLEVSEKEFASGDNYGFLGAADTSGYMFRYLLNYTATLMQAVKLDGPQYAASFSGALHSYAIYSCDGDPKGAVRIAIEEADQKTINEIENAYASIPAEEKNVPRKEKSLVSQVVNLQEKRTMLDVPQKESHPPFEAYKGNDPYIFVSYSHKDSEYVYLDLVKLEKKGYRIWYDEGIDPGNEWPDEVATALSKSTLFLVFISFNAVASLNVKNEINFAINNRKQFLAVYIFETELPIGLQLRMGDIQAIIKFRMSTESYNRKIEKTLPETLRISIKESEKTKPFSVLLNNKHIDILLIEGAWGELLLKKSFETNQLIREVLISINETYVLNEMFIIVGAQQIALSEPGVFLEIDLRDSVDPQTPHISFRIDYYKATEKSPNLNGRIIGSSLIDKILPKYFKVKKIIRIPYHTSFFDEKNYPNESQWGYLDENDAYTQNSLPRHIEEQITILWIPENNSTMRDVLSNAKLINEAIGELYQRINH